MYSAETRVQSGDWYGSGNLHPGQVFRGSLPLLSPAFYMFPLFITRCLHVRHDVRDPSGGIGNCGRECCPANDDFHAILGILYCRKSTTRDRRLYFPSEGKRAEDFFALKNPTASARFEPANLGTKGQHATPRPPKPLLQVTTQKYVYSDIKNYNCAFLFCGCETISHIERGT